MRECPPVHFTQAIIWPETHKQTRVPDLSLPRPGKLQKQVLCFISTKRTSPMYKEKYMLPGSVTVDSRCRPKAERGKADRVAIKATLQEAAKGEEPKNLAGGRDKILCVFRQVLTFASPVEAYPALVSSPPPSAACPGRERNQPS